MKIRQAAWAPETGWTGDPEPGGDDVTLLFGSRELLERPDLLHPIAGSPSIGCSTSGEIHHGAVRDNTLVVTHLSLESSRARTTSRAIQSAGDSFTCGKAIADSLREPDLAHVFVLSDGLSVNGSELVRGLSAGLPGDTTLSGGLAGDGDRFERTVIVHDGRAQSGRVAALGLYGDNMDVRAASLGGWDPFGPKRTVTRSEGNVLFELDHQSALGLYRKYLGEHAAGLPGSGLLFPLCLESDDFEHPVVRTLLQVDEAAGALTFAGDVPAGVSAQLMVANFDRLVDGAQSAAGRVKLSDPDWTPDLAILVSCVGRKLILKQRIEEEVEAVRNQFRAAPAMTGFYSYGEISPFTPGAKCELHNQTMTITAFRER